MSMQDAAFYVMDLIIFIMFVRMLKNSMEVKLEVKTGMKWLVPLVFGGCAAVGWFRFEGTFRIIQTVILIVFGVMYYFMKSGLSEKGIVMMGSLTTYEKAGTLTLSAKNSCIYYKLKGRDGAMFFDPDQMEEIRKFLKERALSSRMAKHA